MRQVWLRRSWPAVLLVGVLAPLPARAAAPVFTLTVGQARFWNATASPLVHDERDGDHRDYRIVVRGGGYRLRVAYTAPTLGWEVDLLDPSGADVTSAAGGLSGELYVMRPRPGTWTARLRIGSEDDTEVRLRAKLERAPAPLPAKPRALLPNLRLLPPYEFTFASALGIRDTGTVLPSAATCNPDDIAEYRAYRCLRFSLGPANVGAGPLSLRYGSADGVVAAGTVYQRILDTAGQWAERPAGQFEYHKTHAHYHHTGFGSLELLRVTDPRRGTLAPAGTGPKQGFCTVDIVIADWRAIANEPQYSTPSDCGSLGPTGAQMGLSAGWTDVYQWSLDGNYVDIGTNGDGLYVVRSTADALGQVLESDETDNTSYAYVRITGNRIEVLERGRGNSPWDRRKVLADDGLHPLAEVQVG